MCDINQNNLWYQLKVNSKGTRLTSVTSVLVFLLLNLSWGRNKSHFFAVIRIINKYNLLDEVKTEMNALQELNSKIKNHCRNSTDSCYPEHANTALTKYWKSYYSFKRIVSWCYKILLSISLFSIWRWLQKWARIKTFEKIVLCH